jgi:hypothetical protein
MDDKMIDMFLKKANKMQQENPEEFEKKLEEAKDQIENNQWKEKIDKLDDDKKQKLNEMIEQVQNIKNSTNKEEKARMYEEMREKLSPEEQIKLQKAAKLLKGMMKKK